MKYLASFLFVALFICFGSGRATSQSGRRSTAPPKATFPVPLPDTPPAPDSQIKKDAQAEATYQCLDTGKIADGATASADTEEIFSSKDLTTKAQILSKPEAVYTREARRNGTSGKVTLRVVLSSTARVTSVKVIKGLPDGLTESAVKAACAIRFKPATKDDHDVAQAVTVLYSFWTDVRVGPGVSRPPLSRP